MYSLRKPFGGLGTCRKRAKRSLMLSTVRPEPSESVLSKRMQWALNVMFLENSQQKMLPNGLEPPLPASEAGALSLKLRKHRKKYKTKSSALQDSIDFFQLFPGFFKEKQDF